MVPSAVAGPALFQSWLILEEGLAAPHDFLSNFILPSDITGYSTSGVAGIFSTTGVDSVRPKVMA